MITANERGEGNRVYRFRTDNPEIAAERLGRTLRVVMWRVTGDHGGSGIFQSYRPLGHDPRVLNSHGTTWHIGR